VADYEPLQHDRASADQSMTLYVGITRNHGTGIDGDEVFDG
jgi:hypothetical protein